MAEEEKGKVEKGAEKTGQVIGDGAKKGWGAVKGFGKGIKKGVEGDKEKKGWFSLYLPKQTFNPVPIMRKAKLVAFR